MSTLSNSQILESNSPDAFGWQSLGPVTGHRREGDALVLECGGPRLRISTDRGGMIRVRLAPSGVFARDHSWSVTPGDAAHPAWKLDDENGHLTMVTSALRVVIQKAPCRISFHSIEGEFLAGADPSKGIAWDGDEVRCWMRLQEDDHFFGLGERGAPLDKRGQVVVDWNHDAAEHDPWTDPLYQSHPMVIVMNAGRAYGLFFDNAHRATFDLGKTHPSRYSFGADGGEMNFYFIPGPTAKEVVRRYGAAVGTQSLPPLWALGYQQCRWSYDSADRIQGIAKRLRKHRIPCDTLYLDIDYMDGFRCFTWNRERFPATSRLLRELKEDGFRTVVIIDPGIKKEPGYTVYDSGVAGRHFCLDGGGRPYVGKVWPGESVYPDFTRAATRKWWGDLYKGLLADGVAGFWNDMNEPADFTFGHGTIPLTVRHDNDGAPADHRACHNVYGMQMARATYEGVSRLRANERPFVLTRAGFSGVQRYAAVWTGDNLSSWEHLRMSIPMLLNLGLSGVAFCGADIGGFRGHPTAELYTRWLQLGIFYPLCRTHTCGGVTKDAPEQDPTAFGKRHTRINRGTIERRYQLLPYLYTQMHETERTGLPVMRPLLLDFPEHEKVHRSEHEFMWGDALFVAPVVEERATTRTIRLPAGDWYEFDSGRKRKGGMEHALRVRLDSIPIFARAGAIIPMRDVVQTTEGASLDELHLAIHPGAGQGIFFNDDGISFDYRIGEFVREEYASDYGDGDVTFRVTMREGREEFAPPIYLIQFRSWRGRPACVRMDDVELPPLKKKDASEESRFGWWIDKSLRRLMVRVAKPAVGAILTVSRKTE